ncbi:zinc finger CCCH domain-containing protein 56-like [Sesamum indicum]|uniref:Zinc finger CCCH domain-containing protein 56-like n=1 Tax=Sesamum indicum TaxID=4182 RepID=A0A6I9TXU1_SESIN|nr:zinc finger CCCH domain-containing protein 56-like [Sesamum indicum]XP_020549081.1 zinc finger CCCH domain-containing protein 56-like [Sesamum indicum]XP_020549089.1 zinc finger CCCH domain-containing protein 56-like [Sesamum indicum]XP_020549092.1 zinc finger CCCH domain-containing protein 56-like [Sesamum indicum]XP_020549094.1 zinc finger CCCH domain-containing protein 56-like [Sesamum indicum]
MDSHQPSGSPVNNVIEFQSGNSGISFNEDMVLGSSDQAVWASEDGISNKEASVNMNSKANHEESLSQFEVGSELAHKRPTVNGSSDQAVWVSEDDISNKEASVNMNPKANHEERLSQFEVESELTHKRARNSPLVDLAASNSSRAFGVLFHKTKLCCRFQVGTCSFNEKCNFAHSIEELRQPPLNWQKGVAARKEEQGSPLVPREVTQILLVGSNDETQGCTSEQCMKLCSEEGCPYGENCNLIHYEDSKNREHLAICLLPGTDGRYRGNRSKSTLNAANWKTRLCNKWESAGYCPFRSRCHFAHGPAELRRYGGGLPIPEAKDSSAYGSKGGAVPTKASAGAMNAPTSSVPHPYRVGAPSRRLSIMMKRPGETPTRRWKGPESISKVYGDWIDDLE